MNNLILHAAKDYDIEIHIVKKIYKNHKNNFYEKLEEYIKHREHQA